MYIKKYSYNLVRCRQTQPNTCVNIVVSCMPNNLKNAEKYVPRSTPENVKDLVWTK